MTLPHIDPVALSFGNLQLRWYGLMYLAGFGLGWWLGRWRASRPNSGWRAADVDDLLTCVMIGIILGGRLGYVLFYDLPIYLSDPMEILRIWNGGMSFHGGLLGVLGAFWYFARTRHRSFLDISDLVAPLVPPGLFFGRMGNYINGELWGRETTVPWAIRFCNARIQQMYGFCPAGDAPRHPSQLYEAGLEGLLLFAILAFAVYRLKWLQRRGAIVATFLIAYGLFRLSLEGSEAEWRAGAREIAVRADGPVDRAGANAEHLLHFLHQGERVFARAVHLVDKDNDGSIPHTADFHQFTCLCFHTFCTIHHNNYTIHSRQSTISIFGKVLVTRSIEDIDFVIEDWIPNTLSVGGIFGEPVK